MAGLGRSAGLCGGTSFSSTLATRAHSTDNVGRNTQRLSLSGRVVRKGPCDGSKWHLGRGVEGCISWSTSNTYLRVLARIPGAAGGGVGGPSRSGGSMVVPWCWYGYCFSLYCGVSSPMSRLLACPVGACEGGRNCQHQVPRPGIVHAQKHHAM